MAESLGRGAEVMDVKLVSLAGKTPAVPEVRARLHSEMSSMTYAPQATDLMLRKATAVEIRGEAFLRVSVERTWVTGGVSLKSLPNELLYHDGEWSLVMITGDRCYAMPVRNKKTIARLNELLGEVVG